MDEDRGAEVYAEDGFHPPKTAFSFDFRVWEALVPNP
jgi:hypothetical protein